MKSILFVLGLIILVSANNHLLNDKYSHVLDGKARLTEQIAREIYGAYKSVHAEKSEARFKLFKQTLEAIQAHNLGGHSWKKGISDFTDITEEEFAGIRLSAPQNCSATYNLKVAPHFKNLRIPENYDWSNYGVVSPVKNQGQCGSCWTFSTVGAMESHWNILGKGRNVTFSEQQLVDCAGDFENHGCEGGLPSHAFEYIRYAGGLELNETYPYTAKDGQCTFRRNLGVGYVRHGSFNITQGDEAELAERLYSAGPVSVSYQVISGFKDYKSGVYSVSNCGTTTQDVNHAVLAVGYGVENGKKYWRIKNSWGTGWGDQGFFKIERGTNMCAIAQCNSYPLIDRPMLDLVEA